MKIFPVEAALFHAGRQTNVQTDMTKLIVAFSNFANALQKVLDIKYCVPCLCRS